MKRIFRRLTFIGFVVGLLVASGIFLWVASLEIPSLDGFADRSVTQSTKIYDRTGKVLLFDLHEDIRRTVVPLEEMSRNLKNATIAIEDAEFYEHHGVRILRTLKAIYDNAVAGKLLTGQGGSTITQQVVKNPLLTRDKTITRKVKEWILAVKLDSLMSKDDILTMYLNDSPYGGTIYGAEEASQYYFGISAADLSIAQAAYIAALPQRPTYYSPYGPHKDALEGRKELVLAKMYENGFITKEEYNDAQQEVVTFAEYGDKNIKAPHFVFYVRDYLEEKYGRDAVYEEGLKVISTIDYTLQKEAEITLKEYALQNKDTFNAENAAMVAIDPNTGQVLAMVGSRDYFDEEIDGQFNVATALRQPGSTFKPIAYSLAFEKGYTPSTVLFDLPTQFSLSCEPNDLSSTDGCYAPQNYDGRFRGPITMANALAQSINIPAVKTLYLAGVNNVLEYAKTLGITSLNESASHYGFSLVLGGGEVSLLELTNAYSAFANDGMLSPHTSLLRVEDNTGKTLEEYKPKSDRALSANSAREISQILSDNNARAPIYGVNSPLFFTKQQVAAKTGTTNSYRDAWIVGYTPNVVVGAWAGNNDNSAMQNETAGFILAPMWRELMLSALDVVPDASFLPPDTATSTTEVLKPVFKGVWQTPSVHSILHWVSRDDPTGAVPSNPSVDPQYSYWEYPVRAWANNNSYSTSFYQPTTNNTNTNNTPQVITRSMHLTNPSSGAHLQEGSLLTGTVSYTTGTGLTQVEYYLDGVFVGSSNREPFSISVILSGKGRHTFKAIGRAGFVGTYADEVSFFVD